MRIRIALLALVLSATSSVQRCGHVARPGLPDYAEPAALGAACAANLAKAQAAVKRLERRPPARAGWRRTTTSMRWSRTSPARSTCCPTCIPTRPCATPARPASCAGRTSSRRWRRTRRCTARRGRSQPRDAIDREVLKQALEGFEDSGVSLPPAQRRAPSDAGPHHRARPAVRARTSATTTSSVAFTEAELKGVPEGVWKNAKRDDQGRVLLGLDYPTSMPVLQSAADAGSARAHVARQDKRRRRRPT